MRLYSLILFCCFPVYLAGCFNVQPENPYDPQAPLSVQFKGKIKGQIHISGENITESYLITLLDNNNIPVANDIGEIIRFRTRSSEAISSLEDAEGTLVTPGSFEAQLEAGTYSFLFDPVINATPQFTREQSTPITIRPGQSYQIDIYIQTVTDLSEFECLRNSGCSLGSICVEGTCVIDVDADRDQDGVPDGLDNCPAVANPNQLDNDQDDIGDLCDLDDDNDGIPDSVDNCSLVYNPQQGNANPEDVSEDYPNGIGNACDPNITGISIKGILDYSELPGADHSLAQVYLSGVPVQTINREGEFFFEQAIAEPGTQLLRVTWPGFEAHIQDLVIPDQVSEVDVGIITLIPSLAIEELVPVVGTIKLEGRQSFEDIVIRSRVGGSLVSTTLSDQTGAYALNLPPVDQTLEFSKVGYLPIELDLVYQTQGENIGQLTHNDVPVQLVEGLELTRLTGQLNVIVNTFPQWIPENQRQAQVLVIGEGLERSVLVQDASVTLTDLPAGDYLVFAERAGFTEARQAFTISSEITEISVELNISLNTLREARLDISGLALTGADLRSIADLRGADLGGVNLSNTDLCNLDLSDVSLIGANLSGSNLSGSNLSDARLDNVLLNQTQMHGVDFTNANFFGANLDDSLLYQASYSCEGNEYISDRTVLVGASFASTSLQAARFISPTDETLSFSCDSTASSTPIMNNIYWNQTNLSRALLRGIDARSSVFTSVNFSEAHLEFACLSTSNLLRVDFNSTFLEGSDFSYANAFDCLLIDADAPRVNLTEASLSGVNLTRANLSEIQGERLTFSNVIFQNTNLSAAYLYDSSFVGNLVQEVDFSNSDLTGSDLRNIQVIDSTFNETNLSDSDLRNSDLSSTNFSGCDLNNSQLIGTNLGRSNLENTDLRESILLETNLRLSRYNDETQWPNGFDPTVQEALGPNTQLAKFLFPNGFIAHGVQLQNANLRGARLNGVDFSFANLDGADLSSPGLVGLDQIITTVNRAKFMNASLQNANLTKVKVDDEESITEEEISLGADFSGANLTNALLDQADLTNSKFINANLSTTDFTQATLDESDFSGALLQNTIFKGSSLNRSIFVNTNPSLSNGDWSNLSIQDSNFNEIDLSGLNFKTVDLSNTTMIGSNLTNTSFRNSNLSGLDLSNTTLSFTSLYDLISCPSILPNDQDDFPEFDDYSCILDEKGEYFLLGPNLKLQKLIKDIDLNNINLSGSDLSSTQFKNVMSQGLLACPMLLPQLDKSICIDDSNQRKMLISSGVILDNVDLSGLDLSDLDLHGSSFQGSDLSQCNLNGTNLSGCNLTNATFSETNLTATYTANTICPDGTEIVSATLCGSLFSSDPEFQLRPCDGTIPSCPDLEFIFIEGGQFTMGFTAINNPFSSAIHELEVDVPSFEIMKTEVSVGHYKDCVDAGVCSEPNILDGNDNIQPTATWILSDDYPINFVSWNQAVEFGNWVSARLPSESEWEFAGRDRGDTLHFPWENIGIFATCDYAVLKGCDPNQYIPIPKPICSRPAGNTALGLCDILGNVSEWVQDHYYFDLSNTPNDGSAFSCDNSSSCNLIARGSNCDVSGVDFSQVLESSLPTLLDYNKNPLTDRGVSLLKDSHSFRVGFRLARTAN